jgi:hypothetical protein
MLTTVMKPMMNSLSYYLINLIGVAGSDKFMVQAT